jgi:hypothetical protein
MVLAAKISDKHSLYLPAAQANFIKIKNFVIIKQITEVIELWKATIKP